MHEVDKSNMATSESQLRRHSHASNSASGNVHTGVLTPLIHAATDALSFAVIRRQKTVTVTVRHPSTTHRKKSSGGVKKFGLKLRYVSDDYSDTLSHNRYATS